MPVYNFKAQLFLLNSLSLYLVAEEGLTDIISLKYFLFYILTIFVYFVFFIKTVFSLLVSL